MTLYALVSVLALAVVAAEPWQPPENPDPPKILREAQDDTRAERFQQALDKHVWYHRHALQIQPAQSGVRRSFALSYWKQLAEAYPAALFKLMEIREEAAANVKAEKDAREAFADFAAINRTLSEEKQTTDLFLTLHSTQPAVAKVVYPLAQPALIKSQEYEVCGHYLEPESARRMIQLLTLDLKFAKDKPGAEADRRLDFAHRSFTNKAATLVALLAVNKRQADASAVAIEVKQAWDDASFHRAIDDALQGNVPQPWP